MKERPILFSGPMVRAILEGRKTQTRRVAKPDGLDLVGPCGNSATGDVFLVGRDWPGNMVTVKCPYGQIGDCLWVKETHGLRDCRPHGYPQCLISYHADKVSRLASPGDDDPLELAPFESPKRWRPSIHMPRWASRITLEITAVRVERLQEITEEDAQKEGADRGLWMPGLGIFMGPTDEEDDKRCSYKQGFEFLWSSINGPESWAVNPWVWVVEFRRVQP